MKRSLLVSNLLTSSSMSFTKSETSTCALSKISNCCAKIKKWWCDSSSELHCQRIQTVSRWTFFADLLSAMIKNSFLNLKVCFSSTTLLLDSLRRFWLIKTQKRSINAWWHRQIFLLTCFNHICFNEQQRSNFWADLCLKFQTWCSNTWSWTFSSNEASANRIITMNFSQKWMRNVSDVNEKHSELMTNLNLFFFSIIFDSLKSTSAFQN